MPLTGMLPAGPDCTQWTVWGTVARLVVTEPAALPAARAYVVDELAAVDEAASRFRPDSELRAVCRAAGRPVLVSQRLAELVQAALRAAYQTDGDVDPTVGAALNSLGYDRDFAELAGRGAVRAGRGAVRAGRGAVRAGRGAVPRVLVQPAAGWRQVRLRGRELTVPRGAELDLGATAKALAADRCARLVADRCAVGVLVALGGDIATAGPAPAGGWRVLVQDRPGEPACTVVLPAGAALATSSTVSRRWRGTGELLHHILDPRTGRPVTPVWRTASVAAYSCLRANTISTAALVRSWRAPDWLRSLGAPARLVGADRRVRVFGGWPPDEEAVDGTGEPA